MNIPEKYEVNRVKPNLTKDWLSKKHYMKRMPVIFRAFGIFEKENNELVGICTYGPPSRLYNNGGGLFGGKQILTYELNRLVVNEGLEKNVLSFFVSQTIKLLEKPVCIVSYADEKQGHHGYIYQSLNFIYTGASEIGYRFIDTETGKDIHQRRLCLLHGTVENALKKNPNWKKVYDKGKKHRYILISANKKIKKEYIKALTLENMPYPKGDNSRYDNTYEVKVSKHNFW